MGFFDETEASTSPTPVDPHHAVVAGRGQADQAAGQRGQMTILVAVMLTALLAFLALTIDGGFAFSHRREMQNSADAASLAGARQIASFRSGNVITDNDVSSAVVSAAVANGWLTSTGQITATYITTQRVTLGNVGSFGTLAPPSLASGVSITTTEAFDTFFGGFIGLSSLSVSADSRAIFGFTCDATCLLPMTVYTQTFVTGATYDFYGSNNGPGQFGWLNFSGGSNTDLCNDLASGSCNSGTLDRYGWVSGSSGNNWGSCLPGRLDAWVGRTATVAIFGPGPGTSPNTNGCFDIDTQCTSGTCTASCGSGSNFKYHIVGFASFRISGYNESAKTLTGTFVNSVADAELVPGCTNTSGLTAVNLIR